MEEDSLLWRKEVRGEKPSFIRRDQVKLCSGGRLASCLLCSN